MGKTNRSLTCLLLLFAVCGFSTPARAYLDPGTGTMLVQLLLGGVAGGLASRNRRLQTGAVNTLEVCWFSREDSTGIMLTRVECGVARYGSLLTAFLPELRSSAAIGQGIEANNRNARLGRAP